MRLRQREAAVTGPRDDADLEWEALLAAYRRQHGCALDAPSITCSPALLPGLGPCLGGPVGKGQPVAAVPHEPRLDHCNERWASLKEACPCPALHAVACRPAWPCLPTRAARPRPACRPCPAAPRCACLRATICQPLPFLPPLHRNLTCKSYSTRCHEGSSSPSPHAPCRSSLQRRWPWRPPSPRACHPSRAARCSPPGPSCTPLAPCWACRRARCAPLHAPPPLPLGLHSDPSISVPMPPLLLAASLLPLLSASPAPCADG